jgi:hypothetical protein
MSLDRDLHDALQPLAGDPVADAMAVLAALPPLVPLPRAPLPQAPLPQAPLPPDGGPEAPPSPPAPRPRHRNPRIPTGRGLPPQVFWWLAGALALGLALGVGLTMALGGNPAPNAIEPPTKDAPPDVPPPVVPDVKKPQPMASEQLDLMLMAFGDLAVDEPGKGRQKLAPGPYTVLLGSLFETGDSLAGIYVYQNDLRVRLDRGTAAIVEPEMVTLVRGRLWFSNLARPADVRVRTDFGDVQADAASVVLERRESSLWVACLEGQLAVQNGAGAKLRLQAGQQVELLRNGPVAEVQKIPFAGSVTSWMTRMILLQQDDTELRNRIAEMRDAFLQEPYRDAAELELRRLGSVIVPTLFAMRDQVAADPDLHRRALALMLDVADFTSVDKLFGMLEVADGETRVQVFHALTRITGDPVGDQDLWRDGSAEARAQALRDWRARVR